MLLSEVKERLEANVRRRLEIDRDLLEMKRAYFQDGVEASFPDRVALEAERARLLLECHGLDKAITAAKSASKQIRHLQAHAILIRLVTEQGMGHLVVEADRLATDLVIADPIA